MKTLTTTVALFAVAQAHADTVITMNEGVSQIPASVRTLLDGRKYHVKPLWTEPHLTLQNLPRDVWQRAQRQPYMAIRGV